MTKYTCDRSLFQLISIHFALSFINVPLSAAYSPVSLTTRSTLNKATGEELHRFLGSPSNWPKIVLSSHSVESPDRKNLEKPLMIGEDVNEIFGLPPFFPLSINWKCIESVPPTESKSGRIEFYSQDGVPGVASDCRMTFDIETSIIDTSKDEDDYSVVDLTLQMEYEPRSPIAILASPILTVDNAVALKLLLPSVLESMLPTPLNKFRQLMGFLYGVAGIAHFGDCLVDSQLLISAGSLPYYELPPSGQAFALLWCAAGPFSYFASRIGGKIADLSLISYGLIEILGAALIVFGVEGSIARNLDPFTNAVLVQGVVLLAWLYSSQKLD